MDTDKKEITFIEHRREICSSCEYSTKVMGINICDVCGCAIYGKTLIKIARCPKGKWNAE